MNTAIRALVKMMSARRMPFYDFNSRTGPKLGNRELVDGTLAMLTDPTEGIHTGVTAERVAVRHGVSRQEQDEFALESHRRASAAAAHAAFGDEITPVTTEGHQPKTVSADEHPRPATTLESLGRLRPVFKEGGSVTAGNSSGINDGAGAPLAAHRSAAAERGRDGLVALEAVATAAVEPGLMG